jgi:periplasmic divalent cation tolerance protein
MIVIYIACKDKSQASKISRVLLEKRLIACVNIFPSKSMYWWENKIQEENEYIIIAKTLKNKFKKIIEQVKKLHSYKIPLIEQWDIDAVDKKYLDWLKKEVK